VRGFVTFDFVLRIIARCMMYVAFPQHAPGMYSDDGAAHVTGFGVPGNVISNFECSFHDVARGRGAS